MQTADCRHISCYFHYQVLTVNRLTEVLFRVIEVKVCTPGSLILSALVWLNITKVSLNNA